MIVPDFQRALTLAFPEATWGAIVRGLREGVGLADDVVKNTPMLNTPGGTISEGIYGALEDFTGSSNFAALVIYRSRLKKAKCLSVYGIGWTLDLARFLAHVVRTECSGALPSESANRRQAQCVKNQYDLLTDGRVPPISEIVAKVTEFYSFLTFGTDAKGILTHVWHGDAKLRQHRMASLRKSSAAARCPSGGTIPAPKSPKPKDRMRFLDRRRGGCGQQGQDWQRVSIIGSSNA